MAGPYDAPIFGRYAGMDDVGLGTLRKNRFDHGCSVPCELDLCIGCPKHFPCHKRRKWGFLA